MTIGAERAAIYRARQRRMLPVLVTTLLYPFLLGWAWKHASYPESFGIHPGPGKGGVYLRFEEAYVLLERHRPWDIVAFVCMWPGVIALIVWAMRSLPKSKEISVAEKAAYSSYEKGDTR